MTAETLLTNLAVNGVAVTLVGDDIKLRGPSTALTGENLGQLRESKPAIVRLLKLADGLPVDDEAAALLAMDEVDPADVPICDSCGRLCDVQTLDDVWHCTPCDPLAEARRRRTERWLRASSAIR